MSVKVFLCHASEDKTQVGEIYRKLKDHGYRPWLDSEDLIGAQDWDAEIQKAVRASDVVAVCLSDSSIMKTGYVQKEIRVALDAADYHPDGQMFILPLRLSDCDIPDRLKKWHAVNFFEPNGFERLERSLLKRGLAGAFIRQPELAYSSPFSDPASLEEVRSILASASPPTTREVMEELKHSVERVDGETSSRSAEQMCVASRTTLFHLQELALKPEPAMEHLLGQIEDLLNASLEKLTRISDPHAEQYVRSIRNRTRIVRDLRSAFPKK